ncbi:glycosyltransferase [Pelagibacteraceae bacterium]|nr:glycosyltransferase [Pelagibacteraceae bacterium]
MNFKPTKSIFFFLPNLAGGGAEKVVVTIVNKLNERGNKVEILLSHKTGTYLKDVNEKIPVVDFASKKVMFSFFKLLKYLRKNKPDILFTTHPHTSFIAAICVLINFYRTKLVIREAIKPNFYYNKKNVFSFFQKMSKAFTLFNAHKIILPSVEMKNDLADNNLYSQKKLIHIYNPIDFELIKKKSEIKEKDFFKEDFIISVARLEKQKDFLTLIKAFKMIADKININLLILGEGDDRYRIEQLINKFKLNDRVFLPGFVDNPYYYIRKSRLLVHSSFAEGLPNSLLQAASLKKIIISTDCDYGPKEIINGTNYGYLVPVGDQMLLAKNIERSLSNQNTLRLNQEFLKKFNIEKIINSYEKLFDE